MTLDLPRATQNQLFTLHKGLGAVTLAVVLLRVLWRLFNKPPGLPASVTAGQARVAGLVHFGLYALLLVMAASGYVRVVAGGFPIELLNAMGIPPLIGKNEWLAGVAKEVHALTKYGLIALIAVHVGAAVYHARVKRDGVVERMWPPFARRGQAVQR